MLWRSILPKMLYLDFGITANNWFKVRYRLFQSTKQSLLKGSSNRHTLPYLDIGMGLWAKLHISMDHLHFSLLIHMSIKLKRGLHGLDKHGSLFIAPPNPIQDNWWSRHQPNFQTLIMSNNWVVRPIIRKSIQISPSDISNLESILTLVVID